MKKIPIPFLLSLLLFLTVPACRHTRQSPVRNGSAPEVAAAVDSHNSRNALDWEDRFRLDVWYVDNQTMSLDLRILWLTLLKVFAREGISAAGEATMTRFTGSRPGDASSVARK